MTLQLKGISLSQNLYLGRNTSVTIEWVSPAQELLGAFVMNSVVDIPLVAQGINLTEPVTYTLIAGTLPDGVVISNNAIVGTVQDTIGQPQFIIRASSSGVSADMLMQMVIGPHPSPTWVTPAGIVSYGDTQTAVSNTNLLATDPFGFPIFYYLVGGSFPSDVFLNATTGAITGSFPFVTEDTEFDFTVSASNGDSAVTRDFTIYVAAQTPANASVWITPPGSVGEAYETTYFSTQLEAVDPLGQGVTYVLLAGDLPEVTILNPSTGVLAGTVSSQPNTTIFKFIAGAKNAVYTTPRIFTATVVYDPPPEFDVDAGHQGPVILGSVVEGNPFHTKLSATTNPSLPVIWLANGLPDAIVLNTDNGSIDCDAIPPYSGVQGKPEKIGFTVSLSDSVKTVEQGFEIDVDKDVSPNWVITGNSLGQVLGSTAFDTGPNPIAVDPLGRPVTFTLDPSTPLPSSLAFDPNLGRVSGMMPDTPTANVAIPLLITATSGPLPPLSTLPGANPSTKLYTLLALFNQPPIWDTPNGVIATFVEDYDGKVQISAHDFLGLQTVYYELLTENPVAPGLYFNAITHTVNGTVGTIPDSGQDIYNFTVQASFYGNVLPTTQEFSIVIEQNLPPIWTTPAGQLISAPGMAPWTANAVGYDPNGLPVIYTLTETNLPDTVGFSQVGSACQFQGYFPDTFTANVSYYAVVELSCAQSVIVPQTFVFTSEVNLPPVWITNAGVIADLPEQSTINVQLQAYDPEGANVAYLISPTSDFIIKSQHYNVILTSNGLVTGNLPPVANDTLISFTAYAWDQTTTFNKVPIYETGQDFSFWMRFVSPPVWSTHPTIGCLEQTPFFENLVATGEGNSDGIIYTLQSGSPPPGIVLSPNGNGALYGTTPAQQTTETYSFTVLANNGTKTSNATFDFTVYRDNSPVWGNTTTLGPQLGHVTFTYNVSATSPDGAYSPVLNYVVLDYGNFPNTVSFATGNNAGITLHGNVPFTQNDTYYTFTGQVSDGILPPVVQTFTLHEIANQPPVWVTPAGNIGSHLGGTSYTKQFSATDPEGNTVTFAIVAGAIPNGAVFTSTGTLSGTVPMITDNTELYSFTIAANDGTPLYTNESFTLTYAQNYPPVWMTNAGSLGILVAGYPMPSVTATDPNGESLTYSLTGGSLPPGITLLPTGFKGNVSLSLDAEQEFDFEITVTDGFTPVPRSFSITCYPNLPPVFTPASGSILTTQFEQTNVAVTLTVSNPNPGGTITKEKMTFDPGLGSSFTYDTNSGLIAGTLPAIAQDTQYSVSLLANNGVQETTATLYIDSKFNTPPVFQGSATLPTANENQVYPPVSDGPVYIVALSNGLEVFYSVTGGTLPEGITVYANGMVSGVAPLVSTPTPFVFQVTATTGIKASMRNYTITVDPNMPPVWQTAPTLKPLTESTFGTYTLIATDPNNLPLTYSLDVGPLPPNLNFYANSAGAVINGTAAPLTTGANAAYSFVVGANNGFITTEQTFNLTIAYDQPPVWTTCAGTVSSQYPGTNLAYNLVATSPANKTVTYIENTATTPFPSWMTLNSATGALGGVFPVAFSNTTIPFVVDASDGYHSASRSFNVVDLWNPAFYDPFSANVAVLANFDTAVVDVTNNNVLSATSGFSMPSIDNTFFQFGSGSAKFTGGNGFTVPAGTNTALNMFWGGPLTIEFWLAPASLTAATSYIMATNELDNGLVETFFYVTQTNATITFSAGQTGGTTHTLTYTMNSVGAFYHVAITLTGTSCKVYVNGTSLGSLAIDSFKFFATPIYFGTQVTTQIGNAWSGWIDDLRFTTAIRYTNNFTPGYAPIPPAWITPANSIIASGQEYTSFAGLVQAQPVDANAYPGVIQYNIVNSLVNSLTLDYYGDISGTMPASGPTYYCYLQAQDTNGNLTLPRKFLFQSNVASNQPTNLVAQWRFNLSNGVTTWAPTINNNGLPSFTATATGVSYTASPSGSGNQTSVAMVAPGGTNVNLHSSVGSSLNFMQQGDWTIEFYFYMPSNANIPSGATVFNIYAGSALFNNFRLIGSSSTWQLNFAVGGSASTTIIPVNAPFSGQWNHFAIVMSGLTVTVFTNGSPATPTTVSGYPTTNGTMYINDTSSSGAYSILPAYYNTLNFWNTAVYTGSFTPPAWPGY